MSYLGQEVKRVYPSNSAIGGENLGQVPLFAVMWCPSRAFIWDGYVAADGQELDDNLFPDAKAGILGGRVPVADGATWLADPTARASYVASSSAGKFRIPDLNGKFAGSLGAVFLRGDGARSAETKGVIQNDEFKSHDHSINSASGPITTRTSYNNTTGGGGNLGGNASTYEKGGSETRPLNATGCWVIKLFGSVVNIGAVDAAQLATIYAAIQAEKVDIASFLGSNRSFTTNGYQRFPGGLIIQWGIASLTASVTNVVSLPISFPVAQLVPHTSASSTTGTEAEVAVVAFNATTISLRSDISQNAYWFAIGY